MTLDAYHILVIVAIILAIAAIIRPAWPLAGCAILLLGVAALIK